MIILNDDSVPPSNKSLKNAEFVQVFNKLLMISFVLFISTAFFALNYSSVNAEFTKKDKKISVAQKRYLRCQIRENLTKSNKKFTLKEDEECKKEAIYGKEVLMRTKHLHSILKGHPMDKMAEELAEIDPKVAAFVIGIGKQESNWGKRSPWKNGKDCYNYWGYKTTGSRGKALGHACFGSRKEAVDTVAKRISHFVYDTGRNTPEKMLVWKCGRSCATHNPTGVARWVSTVRIYSKKVLNFPTSTNKKNKLVAVKSQRNNL